jgi:hypothetical protein
MANTVRQAVMLQLAPGRCLSRNFGKAASPPVGDYSGTVAKDDPAEPTLVRKIDWRIMPTLWCMYFMNYVRLSLLPASHDARDGS